MGRQLAGQSVSRVSRVCRRRRAEVSSEAPGPFSACIGDRNALFTIVVRASFADVHGQLGFIPPLARGISAAFDKMKPSTRYTAPGSCETVCSTRSRNKLKYALVSRLQACRTRCQPSATRSERAERMLLLIAAMIQHPQHRNQSLWGGGCVMRRRQPSARRRKERKYVYKYHATSRGQ